ncbi:DNA repair protein RadA [[Clostridium] polysaccharolyticum]|uniref:DNA repair protein RadA n=1 Tax=[Clostridium] polysaccharolyticum TaxID=29364 RepID=A0A1H9YY20_9FIRM|nr:DNA repair protein RadA [[Clostridium] polysaccharolyticum]SES73595.1 DNA repair protein RadA/Sms [[Clostridium] polysaccharolyticum]
MAKTKIAFFCKECGFESNKWLGKCPACNQWDTFAEAPRAAKKVSKGVGVSSSFTNNEPLELSKVSMTENERLKTGMREFDRVLGGGIVKGSLVLVGGDPGIGKSTLLLQICKLLTDQEVKVLYISGEESLHQIKMRAERIGKFKGELLLYSETNLDIIEEAIHKVKPAVLIIDSIQTMFKEDVSAAPGSVSQVRESTAVFLKFAKTFGISTFIVGHVTKEGMVAGPRVLEHMVDTVLYFEGDSGAAYRMLRGVKNRFGSTNEIGVFEMRQNGLAEVKNPSEYMLQGKPKGQSGSVVCCSMEGTRPILIETQALICRTNFNMPRRTSAGTDYNRVNLLMAVMEKRLGISMAECDAYVNVAGGMKVTEPALDLAIIAAVLSSYRNLVIDDGMIIFGEVGLTGEVRAVSMAEQRVLEAEKMGYETCIMPAVNCKSMKTSHMKLIGITNIKEIINYIK